MLKHSEQSSLAPPLSNRRSFSYNIRSSLDNASSRFSFVNKAAQSSRRSISGPRSTSSTRMRDDEQVLESDPAISRVFSTYSMADSSNASSPRDVPRDQSFLSMMTDSVEEPLTRAETGRSFDRISNHGDRPGSALSAREDSCSSISSTSTKWYKRFNRNSSVQRLSRAIETSELAFNNSGNRLVNPFSRRRSIPVVPKVQTSILGQTTLASVEIGGYASNASKTLPSDFFPLDPVEVPYIVDACITWLIENHAQMTPGIFRVNGSSQAVRTIAQHFSAGCLRMPLEHIELPGKQMISVHDVASCLKKYLVLLPQGLFGKEIYDKLCKIAESDEASESDSTYRDFAETLLQIDDQWKFNINLVLLAFLNYISSQAHILAAEDDPKQESGFMNAFSLGIVFSPCCTGSINGTEMRRSSTSQSEQSVQSETTPIEEAVANARRGAKVMQRLVTAWRDIAKHLAERNLESISQLNQEDNVSVLNIRSSFVSNEDSSERQGLQTIIDSPIKSRDPVALASHTRSESIDTVVIHKRNSATINTNLELDARIACLQDKILQLEIDRDEALSKFRLQQAENAQLAVENAQMKHELLILRAELKSN